MGDLFWLSKAQMRRIEPYFPLSHGMPRVDDRKVISGIIFVIRNGLRWRDAPAAYGPTVRAPSAMPGCWGDVPPAIPPRRYM
jgi:transposase